MGLTERYLLPGERRHVDVTAAAKLRQVVLMTARDLGLDKVTTAVVLTDHAVELFAANNPPYPPEMPKEAFERALVVHYGNTRPVPTILPGGGV